MLLRIIASVGALFVEYGFFLLFDTLLDGYVQKFPRYFFCSLKKKIFLTLLYASGISLFCIAAVWGGTLACFFALGIPLQLSFSMVLLFFAGGWLLAQVSFILRLHFQGFFNNIPYI